MKKPLGMRSLPYSFLEKKKGEAPVDLAACVGGFLQILLWSPGGNDQKSLTS